MSRIALRQDLQDKLIGLQGRPLHHAYPAGEADPAYHVKCSTCHSRNATIDPSWRKARFFPGQSTELQMNR